MPKSQSDMDAKCRLGSMPADDRGCFEEMTRVIFRSGLKREMVDRKWPAFRQAFDGFEIDTVAGFGEEELDELMKNDGIIRNYRKLKATADNARTMQELRKEHGSFAKYLDTLRPAGEAAMSKTLSKRFSYLGGSTVLFFLRSLGEEMPESVERWRKKG